jgi:hypothetical protein
MPMEAMLAGKASIVGTVRLSWPQLAMAPVVWPDTGGVDTFPCRAEGRRCSGSSQK